MFFRTQERNQKICTFDCVKDLSTREAKISDAVYILEKIVTAELGN